MSEKKTLKIGDVTYVISHAPASTALRAAATLANGLAPLLNGYRRGRGGELDKLLLGFAETFADPALAANLERLCELFRPHTQVVFSDGRSLDLWNPERGTGCYEEHFAGRFDALLTWLRAAVEFDLGGFLAEAREKMKKAADAAKVANANPDSKSESPPVAATTG